VAVALIPALLFGGAVIELREWPAVHQSPRLLGLGVAGLLGAGVVAEVIAIRGTIDPAVGDLERRYLVFVLMIGTAGLAIWIAAPLLRAAIGGTRIRLGWREVGIVLAVFGIVGQFAITDSLDQAAVRFELETASNRFERTSRELNRAEQAESAARTQLLELARSTSSDRAVAVVVSHLHQLDDQALGPMRESNLNMGNAERHVRKGFRRLNAISRSLGHAIEVEIGGIGQAERELLVVAQRRLISATAPTIGDKEAFFFATKQFRRTCTKAAFLGCR
jgi:hypothetical protein